MGFVDNVHKATRGIRTRLSAMVKRAILEAIDDTAEIQTVQVSMMADEVADGCEHLQPYGVSFKPAAGAEAVALAVQGDSGHLLILGAQRRGDRPTGLSDDGTGGLYFLGEWKVFLDKDGHVHLGAQTGAAKIPRDDKIQTELQALWDAIATHTHSVSTTGSATAQSGTAAPAGNQGSPGATACDNVHGT